LSSLVYHCGAAFNSPFANGEFNILPTRTFLSAKTIELF